MKKHIYFLFLIVSVILLPMLFAVYVFDGCSGLGISLILFFVIYPLLSFAVGVLSGLCVRCMYLFPAFNAVCFFACASFVFSFLEYVFLIYAAAYLAIGYLSMLASLLVNKFKRNRE